MTTQNKLETVYESAAETAKKIRQALKANFKGVKFSVRSQTYAGGSSVHVSWVDLPLREEVEAALNKFNSGSFDGMTDMYTSTGYMFEGKKYNGAKYITAQRELSTEYKQQIKDWMKDNYAEINEHDYNYRYHLNKAELLMIEEMNKPEKVEIVENNQIEGNNDLTLTVELNEELNGIELYFSSKPSQNLISTLKENGFRWHKRGCYWYAKQSPERSAIVEGIQSIVNSEIECITKEFENAITTESEQVTEVEQILINDSELIGRKVFGQWGVMEGWEYGIIIGETIYKEVIIKWEDGHQQYFDIKNLVFVHESTNLDAVGVYLLPVEQTTNEPENDITIDIETQEATPEYTANGKLKVKSIKFIWSESNMIPDGLTVNTFKEAELFIREAAQESPDDGCYDKTKFLITWTDGEEYTGRIDIVKDDMNKLKPLKDHILDHCEFYAGIKQPSHMTKEQYDNEVNCIDQKETLINFINTYTLDDETQPEKATSNPEKVGKVLDFNSKFKQKQEKQQTEKMFDHFIDNILPYITKDEQMNLVKVYDSGNDEEIQAFFNQVSLSTAVRKAKDDMLKQN